MKVPKKKALKLIDAKIDQFNSLLYNANANNIRNRDYKEAYADAELMISSVFSEDESKNFRKNSHLGIALPNQDESQKLQGYKRDLEKCISQLKAYKNKVENDSNQKNVLARLGSYLSKETVTFILTIAAAVIAGLILFSFTGGN